jgi:hypothetical protein
MPTATAVGVAASPSHTPQPHTNPALVSSWAYYVLFAPQPRTMAKFGMFAVFLCALVVWWMTRGRRNAGCDGISNDDGNEQRPRLARLKYVELKDEVADATNNTLLLAQSPPRPHGMRAASTLPPISLSTFPISTVERSVLGDAESYLSVCDANTLFSTEDDSKAMRATPHDSDQDANVLNFRDSKIDRDNDFEHSLSEADSTHQTFLESLPTCSNTQEGVDTLSRIFLEPDTTSISSFPPRIDMQFDFLDDLGGAVEPPSVPDVFANDELFRNDKVVIADVLESAASIDSIVDAKATMESISGTNAGAVDHCTIEPPYILNVAAIEDTTLSDYPCKSSHSNTTFPVTESKDASPHTNPVKPPTDSTDALNLNGSTSFITHASFGLKSIIITSSFPQLTHLNLSNNQLMELPESLGVHCPVLRVLNLRNNKFGPNFPSVTTKCQSLRELYLEGNCISILYIGDVGHALKVLDLCGNRVVHIPDDMFSSQFALRILLLSGNPLQSLSTSFCLLSGLYWLALDGCEATLDPSVGISL